MTLGKLYRTLKERLRAAGLETPALDARRLMAHALGCAESDPVLHPDRPVGEPGDLDAFVARRLAREPVSKIVGLRGFYGFDFEVNGQVLDPRPDTETLVDAARAFLEAKPAPRILDLCCGSGCVALALLCVLPGATALGADISAPALAVAARNVAAHGMQSRMALVQSDLLAGVGGVFDAIVCNPPYIPSGAIATLDADVRVYDPRLALDGGDDGLNMYRIVFPQIRDRLEKEGAAFFECGIDQAPLLLQMAHECGLRVAGTWRDANGVERVVGVRA